MKISTLLLLTTSIAYGIVWSIIYLLVSIFHGMTRMFNDDFIFLIARLLHINLSSVLLGFIFAFLDGALFGSLLGILLLTIYKKILMNRLF
ncbi:MAG: hypothetical protein M5T52_23455 [Ignavibacteriaceae bacterium]|nr:hypothetical protein [Ignavibacteriaceae bacterium]